MAQGTTRARDLVNIDDASIEFLSPLGKPVHAALPTVQLLPCHCSFLRRGAGVSNALVASDLLTMLRNAGSTDASMMEDGAPLDMQAMLTKVQLTGMDSRLVPSHARLKQLVNDIASWEKERLQEGPCSTPCSAPRIFSVMRCRPTSTRKRSWATPCSAILSLVRGAVAYMMNRLVTPGAALSHFMNVLTVMGKAGAGKRQRSTCQTLTWPKTRPGGTDTHSVMCVTR